MTEYKCLVQVEVSAADGSSIGRLPLSLPFVPYVGLIVIGIEPWRDKPGLESTEIEAVAWDMVNRVFVLYLEYDSSAFDETPPITLAKVKTEYNAEFTWTDGIEES